MTQVTNNAEPFTSTAEANPSYSDAQPTSAPRSEMLVLSPKKDARFWAIILALSIACLLSALDSSIISIALPTIANDLGSQSLYVWTINGYFLTSTAVQPLYGQTANIFGRRWLMILAVAMFAVGSGIAGGATNTGMLIAGRCLQGIGGGGINMLTDLIVCDLLPQRERGKYLGIIFAVYGIGTTVGPLVGGAIVQHTTWRWIFYLNLPICFCALVLLLVFLHVNYQRDQSVKRRMQRIDYFGNVLLMGAVVAVLLGLIWGGTKFRWSSFRIILPLVLGVLGMSAFVAFQASPLCKEPTMPLRLMGNRTSAGGYTLTFIHAMLMYWASYFMPVYFQAVLYASQTTAGVYFLPLVGLVVPGAILAGVFITATGLYRPMHFCGFGTICIGFGLFTMLDHDSTKALWAIAEVAAGVGIGILLTSTLPAIQVSLPESDVATSTGMYGFIRSFGGVWGVSIPSVVFNSHIDDLLNRLGQNDAVKEALANGAAYQSATKVFMSSLDGQPDVKEKVLGIYVDALKLVWQVGLAFALLGIVVSLFIEQLKLKQDLNTEFGLDKKEERQHGKDGIAG